MKSFKEFLMEADSQDQDFEILNSLDKNWRNCDYVKNLNQLSKIIKTNKFLLQSYCTITSIKYAK